MHKCPYPDCNADVPRGMLACRHHWYRVPKELRQEVWKQYKTAPRSNEHLAAITAAIESMRQSQL